EGHLVDARTDVYGLGVVLYELLAGVRPFRAATPDDLLRQVEAREPRAPHLVAPAVPPELSRVCLKALSRRALDRYPSAQAMADALRHFEAARWGTLASPAAPPPVVPRGLRAFDAADAGFFPALLPGPRDRDGLPESIRFWKARLEETRAENTFRVGLLYGPS